jgi:hypothetical protein
MKRMLNHQGNLSGKETLLPSLPSQMERPHKMFTIQDRALKE